MHRDPNAPAVVWVPESTTCRGQERRQEKFSTCVPAWMRTSQLLTRDRIAIMAAMDAETKLRVVRAQRRCRRR